MSRLRDAFLAEYTKVRPLVLQRDGYRCVKCGYGEIHGLEAHHLNGYADNRLEFLRTLCYFCHRHAVPDDPAEYFEWELSGVDGWTLAADHLEKKLGLSREEIRGFLHRWLMMRRFAEATNFQLGRAVMRRTTGRCEGRKPYGFRQEEELVLQRMRELAAAGGNYSEVARTLNAEDMRPRGGGEWHPYAVARILQRSAASGNSSSK